MGFSFFAWKTMVQLINWQRSEGKGIIPITGEWNSVEDLATWSLRHHEVQTSSLVQLHMDLFRAGNDRYTKRVIGPNAETTTDRNIPPPGVDFFYPRARDPLSLRLPLSMPTANGGAVGPTGRRREAAAGGRRGGAGGRRRGRRREAGLAAGDGTRGAAGPALAPAPAAPRSGFFSFFFFFMQIFLTLFFFLFLMQVF